ITIHFEKFQDLDSRKWIAEEIKIRNLSLHKIAGEQEEELRRTKIINEKKNEFISIASHEIKTPITIIKAYTQLVKNSEGQCSDKIKGFLDKIDHQTTKLVSLVQQLLDVSKIENGSMVYAMESIALNPFINDMVSVMKNILPHHEVVVNLPDEWNVQIDKLRMEQVFSNLIGNAAKYSGKNTLIKIDTSIEGEFVKIAVEDEGIGMSDDSVKSIFEKFYRDKDVLTTHSGLGMGLYIASKIISDHGGKIWVESEKGKGSTFFFTIPFN
ncbi:MAG: HAMP domain-containing histidine kinase, partial [Chryseobacterium sp.]